MLLKIQKCASASNILINTFVDNWQQTKKKKMFCKNSTAAAKKKKKLSQRYFLLFTLQSTLQLEESPCKNAIWEKRVLFDVAYNENVKSPRGMPILVFFFFNSFRLANFLVANNWKTALVPPFRKGTLLFAILC